MKQVAELVYHYEIRELGRVDPTVHRTVGDFRRGALDGGEDAVEHPYDSLPEPSRFVAHDDRFPSGVMRHAVERERGVLRPVLGREHQEPELRIELQHLLEVAVSPLQTGCDLLRTRPGAGTEQHREGIALHIMEH